MKKNIILILLFILFSIPVLGNDLIQEGSIGNIKSKEVKKNKEIEFIPVNDWKGLKFIFLPKTKSSQKHGYLSFYKEEDQFYRPDYKNYVGKTLEVIKVKEKPFPEVTFKVEETREILLAAAFDNSVDGIALISDIKKARKKWLGKTLWKINNEITAYDFEKNEFNSIKIKKYSPVKVKNIIASWNSYSPIRFIIETIDGKRGYEDINISGTNVSKTLRDINKFEDEFLVKNPKEKYDFSSKVWNAIEKEKVFIGMTKKQVKLSWGTPDDVNKTISGSNVREQWVYSDYNFLYFEDNELTTIQN